MLFKLKYLILFVLLDNFIEKSLIYKNYIYLRYRA